MSHYGDTEVQSLGPGWTVDSGDQLSSVGLLGISLIGAAVAVLLNALIDEGRSRPHGNRKQL